MSERGAADVAMLELIGTSSTAILKKPVSGAGSCLRTRDGTSKCNFGYEKLC